MCQDIGVRQILPHTLSRTTIDIRSNILEMTSGSHKAYNQDLYVINFCYVNDRVRYLYVFPNGESNRAPCIIYLIVLI
jgi:hypothetical protein